MPALSLDAFKAHLRVTHSQDDALLQDYLDGAEDECLQFLDRDELPRRNESAVDECDSNQPEPVSDADDLAPTVRDGCWLIAQAMYEAKDAAEMVAIRRAAVIKWMPYRNRLGV